MASDNGGFEPAEVDDAAALDGAGGAPDGEEPDVVPDDAGSPVELGPGPGQPKEAEAKAEAKAGAKAEAKAEAKTEARAEAEDGYVPDDALGPAGAGGVVLRYDGEDWLDGIPSRVDLVAKHSAAASASVARKLEDGQPVLFMPSPVEELNEYVGGFPTYVLRLYGALVDGSKAEVTITGVDVFFDVEVPDDYLEEGPTPAQRPDPAAKASKTAAAPKPAAPRPTVASFDSRLRRILADAGVAGYTLETVEAHPGRGYRTAPKPFKRVRTPNLQQRKKAIAAVREEGLATASDDRSCYYRKAAREGGLALADWCTLTSYEHVAGPTERAPLCAHVFRVPLRGFRPYVDAAAPAGARAAAAKARGKVPLLMRDRTLVLAWDGESHSKRGEGDLPRGTQAEDNMFMLAITAHWKDDPLPLAEVVLVDVETAPDPRWTTVVCGTPANVLRAFALCWRALAPDICVGFNDSGYDWPFVVEKAKALGLLGWMFGQMTASPRGKGGALPSDNAVLQWNYDREKRVKISAEESMLCSYLKVPGCVPIDARVCYKKLYSKAEVPKGSSLRFYLELVGLPGKADMPIVRMWKTYEAALATQGRSLVAPPDAAAVASDTDAAEVAERMRHVAYYCRVDALRVQQLMVRRNIINDYREIALLSFVALHDSHYYAGGMKVCNITAAYAWRRGILMTMIPGEAKESGKYPGAYVFPPVKGLVPDPGRLAAIDTAAAALREAIGPDAVAALMLAEDKRRAAAWAARQPRASAEAKEAAIAAASKVDRLLEEAAAASAVELPRLTEMWRALVGAFRAFAGDRPVTGLDFSSLYPSLIMTYNLSPEKILLRQEEADYWRSQGKDLHDIQFTYNGRPIIAWSVRHNNDPKEIGLFPEVLIDLFNKRAEVKVLMAKHGAVKELIELVDGRAKKDKVPLVEAIRRTLAETTAELARIDGALAPGAPPPRISPGGTLASELADLKRLGRNAREIVEGLDRYLRGEGEGKAGREHPPSDAEVEAAVRAEYVLASFLWTCANSKQNGIKVTMNSFYGESGNQLSPLFLLALAGGVTAAGQRNIRLVADFVEGKIEAPLVITDESKATVRKQAECASVVPFVENMEAFGKKYGDSVTGDTALIVRIGGVVRTSRIDELVPDDEWTPYGDKEAAVVSGLEVWQDGGFAAVARVIRHACGGPIFRVRTGAGLVDCTPDHGLLRANGTRARPADLAQGDPLLHVSDETLRALAALIEFGPDAAADSDVDTKGGSEGSAPTQPLARKEAFAMGLFAAAEGPPPLESQGPGPDPPWAIVGVGRRLLGQAASGLGFPTRIQGRSLVPTADGPGGFREAIAFRALFYNSHGEKRIPASVLNARAPVIAAFMSGFDILSFLAARARGRLVPGPSSWSADAPGGKELATGLWLLFRRHGWRVDLEEDPSGKLALRAVDSRSLPDSEHRRLGLQSVRLCERRTDKPVYDLETASGHFHVGPGELVVHNTDSLYLVAPARYFAEADAEYAAGRLSREDWFEAMVRITMRALNAIRDDVNAFLKADNGSPYLKMAYEEVLFPVVFTGKKKYYGIPHLNEVNFRPKKLFVRGIDVVKQGQAGLTRDVGNRIMWASMALDNARGLDAIVRDVLRDAVVNGKQWGFDHFVRTDAWKPTKNNIPVQRFIARMRARAAAEKAAARARAAAGAPPLPVLYEMPDPGERFSYVIAKTGGTHDLRGCKASAKKGDRMEFARVAKALGLEVDVAFYMISYVVGLCARFINGAPQYQPPPGPSLTEKKADDHAQKAAKKSLETFVRDLGGLDAAVLRRRGYAYRRAYKSAAAATRGALVGRLGGAAASVLDGDWLCYEQFASVPEPDSESEGSEGEAEAAAPHARDPTSAAVEAAWAAAGEFAERLTEADRDGRCERTARLLGIGPGGRDLAGSAPPTNGATKAPAVNGAVANGTTKAPAANGAAAKAPTKPAASRLFSATAVARRRPLVLFNVASGLDRAEAAARAALARKVPAVAEVAARYEADLTRLVELRRLDEHEAHPDIGAAPAGATPHPGSEAEAAAEVSPVPSIQREDREVLLDFRRSWFEAVGIQAARLRRAAFADHLRKLKDKRLGGTIVPPKVERAKAVAEAVARFRPSGGVVVTL